MSNPSRNIKVTYKKSSGSGIPDQLVIEEEDGIRITMWPGNQTHYQNIISEAFRQLLVRAGDLKPGTTTPYW